MSKRTEEIAQAKRKKKKVLFSVLVALGCIALVAGIQIYNRSVGQSGKSVISARVKGADKAPIKITEFIDFQCPACAQGARYLKQFMRENPDAVQLEMKYYPLETLHRHARMSARYAECAARQNQFWPFHDLLIERQNNWKNMINVAPAFDQMAREVNLDKTKLGTCLQDAKVDELIQANKAEGSSRGVRSTPTYFVNGKMVVGYQSLASELDRLLRP